jgi:hypothetical protein
MPVAQNLEIAVQGVVQPLIEGPRQGVLDGILEGSDPEALNAYFTLGAQALYFLFRAGTSREELPTGVE